MSEETNKKKLESNEIFDNISNSLDTEFDGEEVEEIVEVKEQAESVSQLVQKNEDDDIVSMPDEAYIRLELQSLISSIEVAMDKIQQNLRIGSPPRDNEVLSQLAMAKNSSIKELIAMNKALLDAKVKLAKIKKSPSGSVTNNNMFVGNSSDLLKMVNSAKKNNSLKKVKAEFNITNEKNLG